MMLQNGQSSLLDCIDNPKVGVNNPQNESRIFADSMLFFAKNHFPTQNLLSDAELAKYIVQYILTGYLACNLTEGVNTVVNVTCK